MPDEPTKCPACDGDTKYVERIKDCIIECATCGIAAHYSTGYTESQVVEAWNSYAARLREYRDRPLS